MRLILSLLTLATLFNASLFAISYEKYTGFAIPDEPVLPPKECHPSLWFDREDIPNLRKKKNADEYTLKLWKQIENHRVLSVEFPDVVSADAGKKAVQKYYGTCSQFAKFGAFMAIISEDAEKREYFFDRAKTALLRAYDGPIYEFDAAKKGGPVDEIYRGTWLQNYAAAYDWVQPLLSSEDDTSIRRRLAKEAEHVSQNLHRWSRRPHNHLSKPAWGLASMALTLSEHPSAYQWLKRAIHASNRNTRYFFSEDGIYREGSLYYIFSFVNFHPFLVHYKNVSGVDCFPYFQPAFEYPIKARNSKGWMPNIEDAFIRPFPSHMVAPFYQGVPTSLNPEASLANILQWNFHTTDYTPFDQSEAQRGFNYSGASWDYSLRLDEFLTYDPNIEPIAPSAVPSVFMKSGQTVFRNTWDEQSEGQRWLLFHGVATSDNHEHDDTLSIILQAEGQMMLSDSGYTRKSYGEKIRKEWYRTAAAHNIVTVNGNAPVDSAQDVTPTSRNQITEGSILFHEKEAQYPTGGALNRAIAFVDNDFFVITDTVSCPAPSTIKQHFHGGRSELNVVDKHHFTWTYSNDEYGEAAKLDLWSLHPETTYEQHMGEVSYIKGDYSAYPYVTFKLNSNNAVFLTLLFPAKLDQNTPNVVMSSDSHQQRAIIPVSPDSHYLVIAQNAVKPVNFQSLSTDATIFVGLIEDDKLTRWMVRDATWLNYGQDTYLKSKTPITKSADDTSL